MKGAVWPSGLRVSFGVNRLLMQPGLHLWVLVLERPSQVKRPQLPGPERQQKINSKVWKGELQIHIQYIDRWQNRCQNINDNNNKKDKKKQSSSYKWMCVGILGWNTSRIHRWCRNQRVSLRIHSGGTGTKRGANRYAGQALGGVFYYLTSCWQQGKKGKGSMCENNCNTATT